MKTNKISPLLLASLFASAIAGASSGDPSVDALDELNARMAEMGLQMRVSRMHLLGSGKAMGRTVLASNHGNKQLASDWAPYDPLRGGRSNLTYAIDTFDLTEDIDPQQQLDDVRYGLQIWADENCADLSIDEIPAGIFPPDLGAVQFVFGDGLAGGSLATVIPGVSFGSVDIVHGGFLPLEFFDIVACGGTEPGCGSNILGVNFTVVFSDPAIGLPPQDSDGNGREDVAFRESYYNSAFTWTSGDGGDIGSGEFNFPWVAAHESGHALSRDHFGDVSIHHKKGLTASPKAVMNAIYGGPISGLSGPDKGGHCSDWSAWPTQN
jgi:hypothetical protein